MALEHLLTEWGLPAIVLGTIAEGDAVAFFGGVLAHRGLFPFEAAALAAAAGAFCVDQAFYWLGRHATRFAFAQRMLDRPFGRRLLGWIGQRPILYCLGIRFVYGMKTAGAMAAGAAGIAPLRYAMLDAVSAMIWAHVLTALGYGTGRAIEAAFGHLHLAAHLWLALAVMAALLLAAGLWRQRHPQARGGGGP